MTGAATQNGAGSLSRIDRTQAIAVGVWIAVAIAILILGAPLATYTRFGPGPGFFLRWLSGILLALAILQGIALVQAARVSRRAAGDKASPTDAAASDHLPAEQPTERISPRNAAKFLLMLAALIAYAWFLPLLGFLVATSALSWITLMLLGRPPLRSFAEAVIAALLVRYGFTAGLGVPLPQAELEFLRAFDW